MTTKLKKDKFLQGVACALGTLAKAHGEPGLACMILKDQGLTLTDLVNAGADRYDVQALSKEWHSHFAKKES
jgi:hypothetical protein